MIFTACDALPPNADDCKARDEAKGGSLGEERNAAGAAFGGNPKGRGYSATAVAVALHLAHTRRRKRLRRGRIAALLVACLELPNGAPRALRCIPNYPGALMR